MNATFLTIMWYQTWRSRIKEAYAKNNSPEHRLAYGRLAALAQRDYVIYLAMEKWR